MGLEGVGILLAQSALEERAADPTLDTLRAAAIALAVLAALALLFAAKAGRLGLSLWLAAAYPRFSGLVFDQYRLRPWRTFFLGALNLVVGLFLVLAFLQTQVLALLGFALLAALAVGALSGYAAAYRLLGIRLTGRDTLPVGLRTSLVGGVAAECAFLLPLLGQIVCIGVLCRGLGAAVIAVFVRRRPPIDDKRPE